VVRKSSKRKRKNCVNEEVKSEDASLHMSKTVLFRFSLFVAPVSSRLLAVWGWCLKTDTTRSYRTKNRTSGESEKTEREEREEGDQAIFGNRPRQNL
jgi:hypothetical protein